MDSPRGLLFTLMKEVGYNKILHSDFLDEVFHQKQLIRHPCVFLKAYILGVDKNTSTS